jgi:hypothetical protein
VSGQTAIKSTFATAKSHALRKVTSNQGLIFVRLKGLLLPMNLLDLTISQLKRAAAIKEQIDALNKELGSILSVSTNSGPGSKKKRSMSYSARKRIAAAQRARWAKVQVAKPATRSVEPAAQSKKKTVSRATKAKLSAKLKAYWKAKKAANR